MDDWTPPSFSRRQVVVTALGSGFALAVRPVSAETITTDDAGLVAGPVEIPTRDGKIPAYRARPSGAKRPPVVLVVQEIFGVHEHIKDVCRRLAKRGYLAVAPELFARQGDVSTLKSIDEIRAKVVSKVPDAQVMADLDAAAAWAKKAEKADAAKLAITGFCWGGRISWLYAAHSKALKAAVAWYGRLTGDRTELQPTHPIDVAGALKAPVLGLYGGADAGIPLASVEEMKKALEAAKKPSQIKVYPDAPHGFFADYRPSYRPEAAKDGWTQLEAWFRTHGVA
jgi:carboxymethylenebutenolidase